MADDPTVGYRFAMLWVADTLGAQAAAARGEPYESKLQQWLDRQLTPRFPNPCSEVYAGRDRVACYFLELERCQGKP